MAAEHERRLADYEGQVAQLQETIKGLEEEVVVSKDGCEVITRFPAEKLLVAGTHYFTAGGPLPSTREAQSNLNNPGSLERVKKP